MSQPLVSVIIPIYKVEEFLPDCLESVIHQTYSDLEIICVNDGSPDRCEDILKDYAMLDRRIKVINKVNGGLSSARNAALPIAQGEYVFFLDSDDWLSLDCIENFETLINAISNGLLTSSGELYIHYKKSNKK